MQLQFQVVIHSIHFLFHLWSYVHVHCSFPDFLRTKQKCCTTNMNLACEQFVWKGSTHCNHFSILFSFFLFQTKRKTIQKMKTILSSSCEICIHMRSIYTLQYSTTITSDCITSLILLSAKNITKKMRWIGSMLYIWRALFDHLNASYSHPLSHSSTSLTQYLLLFQLPFSTLWRY